MRTQKTTQFACLRTSLPAALSLNAGEWEAEIGFEVWYFTENEDGIEIDLGKYSESDYEITVEN